MSVTFSSQAPVMAKTQFGHQNQQAKTRVAQFSGVNPNNQAGAAPKAQFGFEPCSCLAACCAVPLALIGTIIYFIARK